MCFYKQKEYHVRLFRLLDLWSPRSLGAVVTAAFMQACYEPAVARPENDAVASAADANDASASADSLADSGLSMDASDVTDAGPVSDAGDIADGGEITDAGGVADSGISADAGDGDITDAGGIADAGNTADGGDLCEPVGISCQFYQTIQAFSSGPSSGVVYLALQRLEQVVSCPPLTEYVDGTTYDLNYDGWTLSMGKEMADGGAIEVLDGGVGITTVTGDLLNLEASYNQTPSDAGPSDGGLPIQNIDLAVTQTEGVCEYTEDSPGIYPVTEAVSTYNVMTYAEPSIAKMNITIDNCSLPISNAPISNLTICLSDVQKNCANSSLTSDDIQALYNRFVTVARGLTNSVTTCVPSPGPCPTLPTP